MVRKFGSLAVRAYNHQIKNLPIFVLHVQMYINTMIPYRITRFMLAAQDQTAKVILDRQYFQLYSMLHYNMLLITINDAHTQLLSTFHLSTLSVTTKQLMDQINTEGVLKPEHNY